MSSFLPDGQRQWRPSKALGQNFLVDHGAVRRIVEAAELGPGDTVLEIGPGKGVLTAALAERAGQVIALEFDRHLAEQLSRDFMSLDNVRIIHADALEFPLDTLPSPLKIVANLPYSVATPILFRLLENRHCLSRMVLMFQKEVAERILAEPGGRDYGVLSIMVQVFTLPELEFLLPPEAFRPRPKVDSAVVSFEIASAPRVALADEDIFRRVVKAAFSQRRKTLRNSLKALLGERVEEVLHTVGIDPMRRAETLTLEEFARLSVACR